MAELVCRADDSRWLAERQRGVTATDIAAIAGLSSYDSLYSCYWRKAGGHQDPAENDRLALGHALEPYIGERLMPRLVAEGYLLFMPGGLYRSADRPWQLATPDKLADGQPVEFKSWGTKDGWGDDGSDVMPLVVRAQVLWQMDVLGAAAGRVGVVFLPSGEFRSYRIAHDHVGWHDPDTGLMSGIGALACQVCKDIESLRSAGFDFWRRVTELDAPTPDGSATTLAALKARFGKPAKDETAELDISVRNCWLRAKERKATAEEDMRFYEAKMREQAGTANLYQVDGVTFARREVFESPVKAHMRKVDRLMPVRAKENSDDN